MDTPDAAWRQLPFGSRFLKRTFDLAVALLGLLLTGWIILIAFVLATIDTRRNGFFTQLRVGHRGKLFRIVKIRTMRDHKEYDSTVTTRNDPRVTALGRIFRRIKIDELPQLLNVLAGQMSLVGPRPDVPGFADGLTGEDRVVLSVRPGITGPATLRFRDEEALLAAQPDPADYNRRVVWPEKTRLNREYVTYYSFRRDLRCLWRTVFGGKDPT